MRLDKFLKVTRIIKRRVVAQNLCDAGNVKVNGEPKKSSYAVKAMDVLEIKYFNNNLKVKVLDVPLKDSLKKEEIEKFIIHENVEK